MKFAWAAATIGFVLLVATVLTSMIGVFVNGPDATVSDTMTTVLAVMFCGGCLFFIGGVLAASLIEMREQDK